MAETSSRILAMTATTAAATSPSVSFTENILLLFTLPIAIISSIT
jgi:hypothetical protein